jgi:hypothetical protein
MPSKKQTHRKLDLTHLGSLNTSVTSEPQQVEPKKTLEEPVATNTVEKVTAPPTEPAPAPVQEPEPVAEAPVENRKFDRRPQRYEPKPLSTLESYNNAAGESFKPGDKIQLFAPWGKSAIAEISLIYHDESSNVWVQYVPLGEIPPNWSWLGGCSRAERIVLAN